MEICSICGKEGKSIKYHIWRMHGDGKLHNPSIGFTNGNRSIWNKGLTKENSPALQRQAESLKQSMIGKPLTGCAVWTKEERSVAARNQGFGGYRENAGCSKKFRVNDSFGKYTCLQSSFELRCSEILNELRIKWIRPKAVKYDGKNYFADFYLPEYDIWLDPKNNYKAKLDAEKIKKVIEQNKIKLFVLLEGQLTKEYIGSLIQR